MDLQKLAIWYPHISVYGDLTYIFLWNSHFRMIYIFMWSVKTLFGKRKIKKNWFKEKKKYQSTFHALVNSHIINLLPTLLTLQVIDENGLERSNLHQSNRECVIFLSLERCKSEVFSWQVTILPRLVVLGTAVMEI